MSGSIYKLNMAPRSKEILLLYKQLLREAEKYPSYMYRTYSVRHIRDSFRQHREETDEHKINDLITYAKSNLEIIKRQIVIGQMFKGPGTIIELYSKSRKSAHV